MRERMEQFNRFRRYVDGVLNEAMEGRFRSRDA